MLPEFSMKTFTHGLSDGIVDATGVASTSILLCTQLAIAKIPTVAILIRVVMISFLLILFCLVVMYSVIMLSISKQEFRDTYKILYFRILFLLLISIY